MTKELIAETLAAHHTWDVKIMKGLMVCAGKGCDWSRKPVKGASNTEAFRQHQADMVAAVLAEQPAPWTSRDDLTIFAALLAKLGGEATVTIAEARNVTGVHVTRWDEPEHMRYRFTLDAPELRDVPPGRIALQLPDGRYKSVDEIRAEAAAMTDADAATDPGPQGRAAVTGPTICRNCGRALVPNTAPRHRWATQMPGNPWLHRAEDFAPDKPIDCFAPEPKAEQ